VPATDVAGVILADFRRTLPRRAAAPIAVPGTRAAG
jgi:hypothetical protein